MKTLKLMVILSLFLSFTQSEWKEIPIDERSPRTGELVKLFIKELAGKNNTYIIENYSVAVDFYIYNKKNYLIDTETRYLLYEIPPKVKVENTTEIDRIIRKYLTPYFKNYKALVPRNTESIRIHFYQDMNGKLQEIYWFYPKRVGVLPVEVVEAFEKALLESKVYLSYDKNNRLFKGSTWVTQHVIYSPRKVRDMK